MRLFLSLKHQWKVNWQGKRIGMDYLALESAARMSGAEIGTEEFSLIQAMEAEVLKPSEHAN